jgi:hypothetical protein
LSLALAGGAALMRLRTEVRQVLDRAPAVTLVAGWSAAAGFSVLASLIALRVWTCLLPILSSTAASGAGAAP